MSCSLLNLYYVMVFIVVLNLCRNTYVLIERYCCCKCILVRLHSDGWFCCAGGYVFRRLHQCRPLLFHMMILNQ